MNIIKASLALTAIFFLILFVMHLIVGIYHTRNFDPDTYLADAKQYDVEIRRDEWGVPHIFGKRDADVAYGFAYAHAEDDYNTIESNIPFYRGTRGRYEGSPGLTTDYLIHLLEIRSTLDRHYKTLSPEVQAVVKGYADGLNYWAAKHPSRVKKELYPITPKDIVAGFMVQHLFFYGFDRHVQELFGPQRKYEVSTEDDALPVGSNAIAVAPKRTPDGATRLLGNSHQPLEGPVAWYEAHLHSEEGWQIHGGAFPGSPVITIGVNPDLGWGVTVNRPDLVDVYVLEINPQNENQYKLDGEWKDFVRRRIPLTINLLGNLHWTITREVYYSEHGPVVKRPHGMYAIRYAGMGEFRHVEQWYRMNKARDFDSWRNAMRMQAILSFNFVYADKAGNIAFFHNSKSPIRKSGFDWQQYLPGDRSDLIWHASLRFDEVPQVINPESGFVASANQTPFQVSGAADNPDPNQFAETLGFQTRMTNRAYRELELLDNDELIGTTDFRRIKFDNRYSPQSRSAKYVAQVAELDYPESSPFFEAQQHLQGWNLATDKDNTQAALGVCILSIEWLAEQQGIEPPPVKQTFEQCVGSMKSHWGRVDVPWKNINRLERGLESWPVAGGPDTLRAIYGRDDDNNGTLRAVAGDGLVIFAEWDKYGGQTIHTIHQYGSATLDRQSPHYADQAPLFANEKLKKMSLNPFELKSSIKRAYTP